MLFRSKNKKEKTVPINLKTLKLKMILIALRMSLLITSLSLIACASLPTAPELWQCGYTHKFNKFRCVNTRTKEKVNLRVDSPIMEGAQCLSLDDYLEAERWIQKVKNIAEQRCK